MNDDFEEMMIGLVLNDLYTSPLYPVRQEEFYQLQSRSKNVGSKNGTFEA